MKKNTRRLFYDMKQSLITMKIFQKVIAFVYRKRSTISDNYYTVAHLQCYLAFIHVHSGCFEKYQ